MQKFVFLCSIFFSVFWLTGSVLATPPSFPDSYSFEAVDSNTTGEGGVCSGSASGRNVQTIFVEQVGNYLFLRMRILGTPGGPSARYKWYLDTNFDGGWSGGSPTNYDYFLTFVNGVITLYDRNTAEIHSTASNDSDIGFQIVGNNVDMYVWMAQVGLSGLSSLKLYWGTDDSTGGIVQQSTCDRPGDAWIVPAPPAQADLSVSVVVNKSVVLVGDTVIFTITLSNGGPDGATNIILKALLPSGYNYVSDTTSQGSYNSGTGEWNVGNLSNGSSATLQLTATINATGSLTLIAEVTACDQPDPDSQPNNGVLAEDDMEDISTRLQPEGIPTLSEWGMIFMSMLLAGSAIWMIRRRQTT